MQDFNRNGSSAENRQNFCCDIAQSEVFDPSCEREFCDKKKKKRRFSIDPLFVIIWAWIFCVFGWLYGISYFLAVLLHELGHYFVAKFLGYKLNKFSLTSYGVSLSYFDQNIDERDEIKIALAGPLINLVTAFCAVGFWWVFPSFYFFTSQFVLVSVVLALGNLLPCYPLDGGRVFVCLSRHYLGQKLARICTYSFNIMLAGMFFVAFVVLCFVNFNPTYLLFCVFLILGVLDFNFSSKYEKVNIFKKRLKNFSRPTVFVVDESVSLRQLLKKISTSKTSLFCLILKSGKVLNLSEKFVLNLSKIFPLGTTLGEIVRASDRG